MDRYAKAVVAAFTTFGIMFTTAIQDGSPGGESVIQNEWVLIIAGTLVSLGAVWVVPNNTPPTNPPTA